MNLNQYKTFLIFLGIMFFLVPAFLIGLNYEVDPNCRYKFSVPIDYLRQLLYSSDYVLELPSNYDDRALLKKAIPLALKSEVVLLGGSRIANVQSDFFVPALQSKVLNTSVTSGTIRDYVALWQIIQDNYIRPKLVFICVEEQSLNDLSQNSRYLSIYDYFAPFDDQVFSVRRIFLGLATNLKDLLSLQTTIGSLELLFYKRGRESIRLTSREDRDRARHAITSSLSRLYPDRAVHQSREAIFKQGVENGLGEVSVFEHWSNHADMMGYQYLRALIRRIKNLGAQPVLVGMPYHPEAYRLISENEIAHSNLLKFVSVLDEIADSENISFYDAINTHHGDFKIEDFQDGVHLRTKSVRRLFYDIDATFQLAVVNNL